MSSLSYMGNTVWVGYQEDVFAGSPSVVVCNFVYLSVCQMSSTVHVSDLRFVSSIEKLLLFLPMTYTDMSFELVCNNQNLLSEWFRGVGVSSQSFAQSLVHPCAPSVVFLQSVWWGGGGGGLRGGLIEEDGFDTIIYSCSLNVEKKIMKNWRMMMNAVWLWMYNEAREGYRLKTWSLITFFISISKGNGGWIDFIPVRSLLSLK